MGRLAIAALLVILLLLASGGHASAHANLEQADPPAGAVLDHAPEAVVLEFSEELDPSFSKVQLFNSAHEIVDPGPGVVDPERPLVLRLRLGELPEDSYTVVWRARSAVDGHITEGTVPFGIGEAGHATSLLPPVGTADPATVPPPTLHTIIRWLNLLAAAVAFGGIVFTLLVWRPALRVAQRTGQLSPLSGSPLESPHSSDQFLATSHSLPQIIRQLILVGGILFLCTNLLFLLTQAGQAANVPLIQAIGAPMFQLLAGWTGQLWIVRMVLALVILGMAWRLPSKSLPTARIWWLALALVGAALLTFSLSAHGAAIESGAAIAIVLDWLHIMAMVAWLGGLIPLLITLGIARRQPERALPVAVLIPQFSRLALTSVIVLVLSGLYSYIMHIGGLDLLAVTSYGRILIAKLLLFGMLLLLGGVNLLFLSPRLRTAGNRLARSFSRTVRIELLLGALVLLAAGAMTSIAPSKTAWEARERLGLREITVGDVHLALWIVPGQIGDNEFAVDVTDKRPGAQAIPAVVLLRLKMIDMRMEPVEVAAESNGVGRYIAHGNFVSMGGSWNIEVILRRAGFDDVAHTFSMAFVRSALANSGASGQTAPLADQATIDRGRILFQTNCIACHGSEGKGDGPAAASLKPPPADLTAVHVDQHPDSRILSWIRDGVPDTAMPAFGRQLTTEQLEDLVAYIRYLRVQSARGIDHDYGCLQADQDPGRCRRVAG